jgi:hypothetical protein
MKQIIKKEDLIGKTIKNILLSEVYYNNSFISFEDGSFVVLSIEDTSSGFQSDKYNIVISDDIVDNTCKELIELGFITNDEYTEALIKEQLDQETYAAEVLANEQANWHVKNEAEEKETLKRLQEKYKHVEDFNVEIGLDNGESWSKLKIKQIKEYIKNIRNNK